MHQNQSKAETILQEVQKSLESLRQIIIAGRLPPDFSFRLDAYENELNQIKSRWESAKNIVAEVTGLLDIAQDEFKEVTKDQGLVRSEESGFDLKSKVLGRGVSHYRFHGKILNGILYFTGKITNKK